jgi:hypothetical protein
MGRMPRNGSDRILMAAALLGWGKPCSSAIRAVIGWRVGRVDMKLEVQIIPVSDVDRSKEFYERLGWRLDDDVAPMEGLRIVQ